MADKEVDDVMDELVASSDDCDQSVTVLYITWETLMRLLPTKLQFELYGAGHREGHMIVIPRLMWLLVCACAMYRQRN